MILKNGFLLIELLVAITIFSSILLVISLFQVISIKNKDLAQRRMRALRIAINQARSFKVEKGAGPCRDNKDYVIKTKALPPLKIGYKNFGFKVKQKSLRLKKIKVNGKALGNKSYSVCLIC